ncbi:hypothetical protein H312_03431 [Anncaliia algerae PRA339]|uniref:ISXO2-like transposase domain-containing protein n=1 Tax=Anncaliia algerae PRA339 TaxID=1288291 RepID=A0A059EWD7_9MICR|nr:hypothetical protein H312_03431 [Anncaliia algerae PRA339]
MCTIEINSFRNHAFATFLPYKNESTILPIIISQIAENFVIWTDEFKSYITLINLGFRHKTICHKYEFFNSEIGVNTHTVESFNNELKLEIKKRRGIKRN